ncbi:MAG: hypothetical protein IT245_00055 [Bacteroidia bacterium]|nr:hypothetical protein [Bacteroidia bacterium]
MKMQRIGLVLVVMTLMGCGDYRYLPTTIKPTYFTGKGDFEFSLNAASLGEIHGAYALTDNIAISATTSRYRLPADTFKTFDSAFNVTSTQTKKESYRDNEIALGYFTHFQDGSTFEVYAGYGISKSKINNQFSDFLNPSNNFSNELNNRNYSRIYFQPAYGKMSNVIDYGFANRFSFIYYPGNHRDFISESTIFTRFGYKYVKVMFQFGFTISNENNTYDYFPFTAGVGLYFQLNSLRKL